MHVFKHITGGGVESWLLQVMQHADRDRFQMDVAVRDNEPGPFDARFEALGASVRHFYRRQWDLNYALAFEEILSNHGPYDVVHCHSVFNGGLILRLALKHGVPVRVAHSHNAPTTDASSLRRFRVAHRARRLARLWNRGVACSLPAGQELFGDGWRSNPSVRLLYCGVDLTPFQADPDASARDELGIPRGAFVVGHVGRFNEQKNHAFLVEIAERILSRDPDAWFLLIGDGELREGIEASIRKREMSHRFVIASQRDDVPRLMTGAMDAFLLPSFHEGLPLVGMEAQAAGLPMVISDAITTEMDSVPQLIKRLSLSQPADEWAQAVLGLRGVDREAVRPVALEAMEDSPFNILNSVEALQAFYEDSLARLTGGAWR